MNVDDLTEQQQFEMLAKDAVPTDGSVLGYSVSVHGATVLVLGEAPDEPLALQFDIADINAMRLLVEEFDRHVDAS